MNGRNGKERRNPMKTFVIGCDNAAVSLKNTLKQFVVAQGYEVEDVGCFTAQDSIYYPYVAEKVCKRIIDSDYEKQGILVCGTGLGMAMTANKFMGIRAGVCHDIFSAERLALSNNGNVICFGERIIGPELAKKCLKEFIDLKYKDGPSTPKVNAITEIELQNMKRIEKVPC